MTVTNNPMQPQAYELNKKLDLYQIIYKKDALSSSPRTELLTAFFAINLSIALILSVLMRWNSDIGAHFAFLLIWFLACIVWNLRSALAGFLFVVSEAVLLVSMKIGYPIVPIEGTAWPDRLAGALKIPLLYIFALMMICLTTSVVDSAFPPPHVRQVAYSGGG